jgi:hypothetical protein
MNGVEIHWELSAPVYAQTVMSEGTVRQWCRMFKDGRTNVREEKRNVRPATCSIIKIGDQKKLKFVKVGASQFLNFRAINFHKVHSLFSTRLSHLA